MRLVATLIVGIIIGYLLQPEPKTETVTLIETETIVEIVPAKGIDVLELLRRIDIDPPEDDKINAECAYALQRITDEPLQGMINYIERRYQGDSCAAYQHQVTYGYY